MDREYSDIDFVGLSDQSKELHEADGGARLHREPLRHPVHRRRASCSTSRTRRWRRRAPGRSPSAARQNGGEAALDAETPVGGDAPAAAEAHRSVPPAPDEAPLVDHVDIFMDVMRMDHDVDVRDRLDIDDYAISPVDALIAKMQIGKINQKDVHDVIALRQGRAAARDRRRPLDRRRPTSPTCARATGASTTTSPRTSAS